MLHQRKWDRQQLTWKSLLPLHILILALAFSLSQPLQMCAMEVENILVKHTEQAEVCMEEHYIDFESLDSFRTSRQEWHRGFDRLLREVSRDYTTLITDESYQGQCRSRYPIFIFLFNCVFLFALICTFGYFIFQDSTTSFGASRVEIFVSVNILGALSIILGVFTYPALNLLRCAVLLSVKLEDCVRALKGLQRKVIQNRMDLDLYDLHASIWDGVVFGVREPVFNFVANKEYEEWIFFRIYIVVLICVGISSYLFYRSNVKSLLQWRKAIPSVVCIGVTFPSSKDPLKLWRVGSGCIVNSKRGLILTNWHLFQRMGVDQDEEELPQHHRDFMDSWSVGSGRMGNESPTLFSASSGGGDSSFGWAQSSSEDAMTSMKRSLQTLHRQTSVSSDSPSISAAAIEFDEFGVPIRPIHHTESAPPAMQTVVPQHRHLINSSQYSESLRDLFPDMKIYIGTATRGHPNWQYEAECTSVESPSSEFTPFGLDLKILRLTKKVTFEGLKFSEDGPSASESMHAFTYSFESVQVVQEGQAFDLTTEGLVQFEMGNPFKLFPADKLRLLGFPASGGYALSVLTTYFTSMSFDYPSNRRGAWCNVNTQLPSGGSGGAAVNAKGQLVGISTQTKGELTNIRSISEATHLLHAAKKEVDRAMEKSNPSSSQSVLCPLISPSLCAFAKKRPLIEKLLI